MRGTSKGKQINNFHSFQQLRNDFASLYVGAREVTIRPAQELAYLQKTARDRHNVYAGHEEAFAAADHPCIV